MAACYVPQKEGKCAMPRDIIINQSKQAFIDALLRLLKHENFDQVTVKQLVLESGYSRRTYYRYFGQKEAILDAMFLADLANYHEYLLVTPLISEKIPELLITFLWPKRQTLQLLARQDLLIPLIARHMDKIVTTIQSVTVPWRNNQGVNSNSDKLALIYSIGGFCTLIDVLFKDTLPNSPQEISESLQSALINLIKATKNEQPGH